MLAVSDDGLGFPPEDAAMIFEKFHRLGDELRRATPGTGLGLYIVKRLVELSGGTVHAESAGPGRGATVSMRWPARSRAMKTPARILVVDDEEHLATGIRENLEAEGYRTEVAHDGTSGARALARRAVRPRRARRHDAEHGRARALRAAAPRRHPNAGAVPHRKSAAEDRVRGFEAGGDDYLPKPFHLKELLLRVAAILRRSSWYQASGAALEFGGNRIDFKTYEARAWDGSEHSLTHKEAMILRALADQPGNIVTREEILDRVWGYEVFPSTRTIDNFIVRLRKRFERNAEAPAHFHTVRGVGYRFTVEPQPSDTPQRARRATAANDDDKLLLKAIRREAVPRRPLWIMRQAGRYLPEYREFRAKHSFKELAGEAELAAEVTLMPLKRYPLDAAIVFADIMSPMPALGIEFDFDPGPVVANPIRDASGDRAAAPPRSRRDRARGHRSAEAHARRAAEEHRAARLLRRAVDARGLSRRRQRREGLSDAARVRGRGAGAARRAARAALEPHGRVSEAASRSRRRRRADLRLVGRPALARELGEADSPAPSDAARDRRRSRRAAHPVPAERAASDGRLCEPAGRGARRRLARRLARARASAIRSGPCKAISSLRS